MLLMMRIRQVVQKQMIWAQHGELNGLPNELYDDRVLHHKRLQRSQL